MVTMDTNKTLINGDEVFFNEDTGEYFETKAAMIEDAYNRGMSEEEVWNALDLENGEYEHGIMYMTEYWD